MLPTGWKPLKFHPVQSKLWTCRERFIIVAAGRGSGKTELALRRLALCSRVNNGRYFYGAPTIQQAKSVAWQRLIDLIPPQWIRQNGINHSELRINTVFNCEIRVAGMDKPHRLEGVQYNGGVLDESADQRPGAFAKSIFPALSIHKGWCWRIGVPKRTGIGVREYKEEFDRGLLESRSFHWESADILDAEVIEQAKAMLDEVTFNEQFRATWESAAGGIYHAFDESINVRRCSYQPSSEIYVGSDFNVDPMCWILGHKFGKKHFEVFDEIFLRNANTPATLTYLYNKYGSHPGGWVFCGDAAGRSRSTKAAISDYQMIADDNRFKPKRVLYPLANPARKDRFAASNAMYRNMKGESRLFIDPTCKHTINDVKSRSYKEGTNEPDDWGDQGHICDALDYVIYAEFPIGWDSLFSRQPAVLVN